MSENTDNGGTYKFVTISIYSNIKAIETKNEQLYVNLLLHNCKTETTNASVAFSSRILRLIKETVVFFFTIDNEYFFKEIVKMLIQINFYYNNFVLL